MRMACVIEHCALSSTKKERERERERERVALACARARSIGAHNGDDVFAVQNVRGGQNSSTAHLKIQLHTVPV